MFSVKQRTMELVKVLKVGFKILVAVGAGIAIFAGMSPRKKNDCSDSNTSQHPQPDNNSAFRDDRAVSNDFREDGAIQRSEMKDDNGQQESGISQNLKSAQDMLGRLFTFVQTLTMVSESFSKLFSKNRNSEYYSQPGYGAPDNNGWSSMFSNNDVRYPYIESRGDGYVFRRISPFIVEYDTDPKYRYNR